MKDAGEKNTQPMKQHEQPATTIVGLSPARLLALSDGVFAVAITLLVLNIKLPAYAGTLNDQKLLEALIHIGPLYLSYILSVLIIGAYWVAHHGLFHYIRRSDRILLWLNILFLTCVTFITFPAALLGLYWYNRVAVIAYGGSLALTGLVFDAIRWYATSNCRLVDKDLDPLLNRSAMLRNLVGPFIYILAIGIALLPIQVYGIDSTRLSIILYVIVPIFYILPGRIDLYWVRHPGDTSTPGRIMHLWRHKQEN